jgi:hypothetical protein
MAGGHVYAVATVLPTGTISDSAAVGFYNGAAPRPNGPALGPAVFTAPGAVPAPGVAASPAPRRTPQEISAYLAGCRRGP